MEGCLLDVGVGRLERRARLAKLNLQIAHRIMADVKALLT